MNKSFSIPFKKYGHIFKLVDKEDAQFIVDLRTDSTLSRFLSQTTNSVTDQEKWIENYKVRKSNKKEYYFITLNKKGDRLGLNRLYNFDEKSFEIGSWLFLPNLVDSSSIIGDIAARDFGFEVLNFEYCRFEVRKLNKSVVRYHLNYGPEKIGEDDLNFYFKLGKEKYIKHRDKLLNILKYDKN